MTAADLVDELGESGPAMTVLRSRLQGTAGASLESIAAAEIGEEFGIGDEGSYVRIEGGNDRLAIELGPGIDIRLEREVTGVRQVEDAAHVFAGEEVYAAIAVVLAIPLGVLRNLVFEPALPSPVVSTIVGLRMGVGAKVAVATDEEPPLFRRQDMDVPAWYWTGYGPDGSVRRAITGFAGSEIGVSALLDDPVERLRRAARDCVMVGEPVIADWASDPLAGGCYSVIGPDQRATLDVLTEPIGRVYLAGEHVNGSGTIDGAILSGEAAARSVIAAMVS
jgi:monoamine oxidase